MPFLFSNRFQTPFYAPTFAFVNGTVFWKTIEKSRIRKKIHKGMEKRERSNWWWPLLLIAEQNRCEQWQPTTSKRFQQLSKPFCALSIRFTCYHTTIENIWAGKKWPDRIDFTVWMCDSILCYLFMCYSGGHTRTLWTENIFNPFVHLVVCFFCCCLCFLPPRVCVVFEMAENI